MTDVVLRCPHCGTTRATPGECEACHEEDVRYYCTNHSPGRWLDTPACPQCGARFGEPARRRATPPRAPAPAPLRPRPAPPAGARRAEPLRRPGPRPGDGRERDSTYRAPDRDASPLLEETRLPTWEDLLRHAERAHRERPVPPSHRPTLGGGFRMGGCLLRLAFMLLLLVFALVSGLFLFASTLFQPF